MKIKSILYTTLLSSVVFGAEQFDPNALTGRVRDQQAQLVTFLKQHGVEHSTTDSLSQLKLLATNHINGRAANGDSQNLRDQITDLTGQRDQLQAKVDRTKGKKQALQADKTDIETRLAAAREELQISKAELETLRDQHTQTSQAAKTLTQQIETLTTEKSQLQGKVDRTKGKKQALQADKTDIETRLAATREELQISKAELETLRDQHTQTSQTAQVLTQRIETLTTEKSQLQEKVDRTKGKNQVLKADTVSLDTELATARNNLQRLEAELTTLQERCDQSSQTADALSRQINDLETEKSQLQETANNRKAKKDALKSQKTTLESQLAESEAQLQQANSEISALRDQNSRNSELLENLQQQSEDASNEQTLASEKFRSLNHQHEEAITAVRDMRAESGRLKQRNLTLEEEIRTLTEEKNSALSHQLSLEAQVLAAKENITRLEAEVVTLQTQILDEHQLSSMLSKLESYELQINDLENDLARRQILSNQLEASYQESLRSKDQNIIELEQRHQGDLLLIAQLQEQVRLLQEAQQTSASSSAPLAQQNGTIPPAPSTPPKTGSKSFKRGTRIPTPMPPAGNASAAPSASQLTGARLKPQSEQTPLAEQEAPELSGRDALLQGIRSRTKTTPSSLTIDQKLKVEGIKADIESGKVVSAFWTPKQQAKESEDLAKSINMADLLIKAMSGIRKSTEDSDSDGSENDDWLDDDSSVAAASSSDTQQISPELLHNLSTIRQIYRDALNIGYEDAEKTIKWSMDKWLLWENDNYKTDGQRAKLDAVIMQYIKGNIDKLTTLYAQVDFNSVVQQNGTPVALHKPSDESQDPLAQSVVMK